MSRIVGVHGAFHQLWGPHEVAGRWVPAVRDGLWHAGVELDPADVTIAFYGDDLGPVDEAATPVAGDADWQRVTVAARVPDAAVKARVILRSVANEGAAWFDDLVVGIPAP